MGGEWKSCGHFKVKTIDTYETDGDLGHFAAITAVRNKIQRNSKGLKITAHISS